MKKLVLGAAFALAATAACLRAFEREHVLVQTGDAVDRGAAAEALALRVDQSVLDLEPDPADVTHRGSRRGGVDGEGAVRVEELGDRDPVPPQVLLADQRRRARRQGVPVGAGPGREPHQHSIGGAQPQVGSPALAPAAAKGHRAALAPDVADTEGLELAGEELLEAQGTDGDQV